MLRVNYFFGQVLSAEDLAAEQDYIRQRLRRRNRLVHGSGVVAGLKVSLERSPGSARVIIEPGLAIDAQGEEIELCERVALALPKQGTGLVVQLRYAERPCRPVPAAVGADAGEQNYSRIEETFEAQLSPTVDPIAVPLARLRYANGRWAMDRRFEPRHPGPRRKGTSS